MPAEQAARARSCSTRSSRATCSTAPSPSPTKSSPSKRPLPRVRDLQGRATPTPKAFFAVRAQHGRRRRRKDFPAPLKCVDCVEAAATHAVRRRPAVERELFVELMQTPESKALRHAFFAERAASQDPRRAGRHADARRSRRSAVIGAGTMGGGIAMNFAQRRHPGDDARDEAGSARQGLATIRKNYEAQVKKGKLKQDKLDAAHGAAHADARLRRPRGRRPRDRGGVRGHGRQGEGVQASSTR